jgi:hypothetical protein
MTRKSEIKLEETKIVSENHWLFSVALGSINSFKIPYTRVIPPEINRI